MNSAYDVIVIGGGPSGMMAAGRAGELGLRVLLLEKNGRLGKKLSITGGGRCNITNAIMDNDSLLENFSEAKDQLSILFSKFSVKDTFTFFEDRNLPLMVEDRNRAFPQSEKAEDVCDVLEDYMTENGVEVLLDTSVNSFMSEGDLLVGVNTSAGEFKAGKIVLATGGLAAPETGSSGEGLSMLAKVGHTISDPNPNLVPLKTSARWIHNMSGLTLNDIVLRYYQNGQVQYEKRGRILFTHFGISGPMVINSAFTVKGLLKNGNVEAGIDLFPDMTVKMLDTKLRRLFERYPKKLLSGIVRGLVPKKIAEAVSGSLGENLADTKVSSVSKNNRLKLAALLKNLSFPITGTMGMSWSIVADGGASTSEIDFNSMTSTLHPNLYIIGDAIDINRPSGGFSLQLCWSMGWVAGSDMGSGLES